MCHVTLHWLKSSDDTGFGPPSCAASGSACSGGPARRPRGTGLLQAGPAWVSVASPGTAQRAPGAVGAKGRGSSTAGHSRQWKRDRRWSTWGRLSRPHPVTARRLTGAGVTRGHVGLLSPQKWPTGALGSGLGFVGDAWGARGGRFQSGGVRVTRGVPSLASAAPGPPVSVLSAGDSAPASLAGPWSWLDAPPPPGASVISLLALLVEARMLLT